MSILLRPGTPMDAAVCGTICFEAFKAIDDEHNFPWDFPSAEVATGLLTMMLSNPGFYSVVVEKEATRDFSTFGEIVEQTPVSVQLKVPRAKVTETCRQLLDACEISDINVQELPVEEVIRQLFGERTSKNALPPRAETAA